MSKLSRELLKVAVLACESVKKVVMVVVKLKLLKFVRVPEFGR